MKVFLTGGSGFVGLRLARALRDRGDEVLALVRSETRGAPLAEMGCSLVAGDITDPAVLSRDLAGCEGVFHVAGVYKVGIPAEERPAMYAGNVTGTERVLDAAVAAGASRILYVSTIGTFGNTCGEVVDEAYHRPAGGYVSYYDETKHLAHVAAEERIARGGPIVIVQPGGIYGPGDHSEVGALMRQACQGKYKVHMFPETGLNMVHVDDAVQGILLAFDRGRIGESYVIGGDIVRLKELFDRVAAICGTAPARLRMPRALIKAAIPFGRLVGKVMGLPPNLGEIVRASDGVTYWARDDKARRELGYAPRSLDQGLRETLGRVA